MLNDVNEVIEPTEPMTCSPNSNPDPFRTKLPMGLQGMMMRGRSKLESRRIREDRNEQEERQAILAAIEASLGDKWPMVSSYSHIEYGTRTQVTTVTLSVPGLPKIVGVWHLDLVSCQWRQVELGRSDWTRGVTCWVGPQSTDAWSVLEVPGSESYCGDLEEALALASEWASKPQSQGKANTTKSA